MLKLLEESGKRFQAFQSEMLEKQLQSEAVEKQKDKEYFFFFFFFFFFVFFFFFFFLQFGKMLGQGNNKYPVMHICWNCCFTWFTE